MNFHHRGNCGCPKRIVHPTQHRCVHCCTENVVEHVHPVHTTVINHHLERNRHVFPHSTSEKNDPHCVDEFGGCCQIGNKQDSCSKTGGCVGGKMQGGYHHPDHHYGYNHPHFQQNPQWGHHHPHFQQNPQWGHHHPHFQQNPHWGNHHPGKMNDWKKPNKWC